MDHFLDALADIFVWFVHGWTGLFGLAGVGVLWVLVYAFGVTIGLITGVPMFAILLACGIKLDRN